ncbi:MAG TPA: phosphatase PAP2 family protein [Solirubrobacteraceae bacterium]|nr:phosphatase PAP2 family protein [Solirubrobacteraceae bacterium]
MSGVAYSAGRLSAHRTDNTTRRSGPTGALVVAGLCVLALALVWLVAELVPAAHIRDAAALRDFTLLSRPRLDDVCNFLLHLLDPLLFVIWGLGLVLVAYAQGRARIAAAVVAIMGLAPLTSETLKPLVAHSHDVVGGVYIGPASWPSGHSTAALALVLSAVLVAPARLRALVASVGALFALAVGCSLLILAWHMPSDVVGGYLVASLWTALAVAVLRVAERRWPKPSSSTG